MFEKSKVDREALREKVYEMHNWIRKANLTWMMNWNQFAFVSYAKGMSSERVSEDSYLWKACIIPYNNQRVKKIFCSTMSLIYAPYR